MSDIFTAGYDILEAPFLRSQERVSVPTQIWAVRVLADGSPVLESYRVFGRGTWTKYFTSLDGPMLGYAWKQHVRKQDAMRTPQKALHVFECEILERFDNEGETPALIALRDWARAELGKLR